jgi:DNA polymerase elongation subunit (family B)
MSNNESIKESNKDIQFQILDWNEYTVDQEVSEDNQDSDNADSNILIIKKYAIRLFGKTKDNKSICCEAKNFTPYFFIKLEKEHVNSYRTIIDKIKEKIYPKENKYGLKSFKIVEKYDFSEFTNFTKFSFLRLEFYNVEAMRSYSNALRKKIFFRGKKIKFKQFESNILPLLRLMHIRQLNAVGWAKLSEDKYKVISNPKTSCNINIQCEWTDLIAVDDISNQNFSILAFDLECKSIDGSFPNPTREGDKIIQIGVTVSRYGEDECYYKHIITLKSCDPIEGVVVESYEDEKDVILAFSKLIRKIDPDFITGYNIKGFDFNYLNERAILLGIKPEFSRLSRIKNDLAEFTIKDLSSAALGENKLKYFDMKGRIIFDVMKVVQRDHKLPSYKLDEVASNFIRDGISNITNVKIGNVEIPIEDKTKLVKVKLNNNSKQNKYKNAETEEDFEMIELRNTISAKLDKPPEKVDINNIKNNPNGTSIIETKNTNGIYIGQYIKICYNDGFTENKYLDGKKFKILDLAKKAILIDGEIETEEILNKGFKVYWTQAKDDIGPNDIFKMQELGPAERAVIAKYCIQDCALCNKLIAKLQIITNNIGMANVCHVPLSFLFLRGQGVKIFSLVAKKCREKDHLIPVIKAKKKPEDIAKEVDKKLEKEIEAVEKYYSNRYQNYEDDEEDEDDGMGYEGATVFEPVTGVHYNPIYVLDFASLYPNAMRLRNLSHEMHVVNPEYDNLKGYIYHDIEYKNSDNTITKCRFAEKEDGTKGIIPQILTELLDARKKYKKQMEKLKEEGGDPFMIAILDGLQLAFKVTANSLYGQTGGPTSPIYKKQIAASTTATGREMLQYSKYFNETLYMKMIELAQAGEYDKYYEYCDKLYKYFPTKILIDESTLVHVCSVENKPIPDSKFSRGIIDYHTKSDDKMFAEYKDILEFMDINSESEFKSWIESIGKMSYDEQVLQLESVKKKCKKANKEVFTRFYDDLFWIVENVGYKNKKEMFKKLYNVMNHILKNKKIKPEGIYGDTDSVFISPHITTDDNIEVKDKEGLKIAIVLGIWASIMITTILPAPMAQEYEKVLWPFIILTKKRYVGNLYEKDPNKFYQKSMGIVLKRRDNAPVVKIVCGNIIDQILNKRSSEGAVNITRDLLDKIITGQMPIDKFIITKTLKFSYKDRTRIVHAVLADRMAERDPGNKPESNDRIPYVYFEVENEADIKLQGDRVEHPDYLLKNNLKIDYMFYITNQIMKPCIQFLELILENPTKLFESAIIKEQNRKNGKAPIEYYFQGDNNISIDEFDMILNEKYTKKNSNKEYNKSGMVKKLTKINKIEKNNNNKKTNVEKYKTKNILKEKDKKSDSNKSKGELILDFIEFT